MRAGGEGFGETRGDAERGDAEKGDAEKGDAERDDARISAVPFLLLFAFLPAALAFAASHALPHSIWGTRHLIVAAGPYALLAGTALCSLRPLWIKALLFALIGCWFLMAGALALVKRQEPYIWCAWEELAAAPLAPDTEARDVYAFEELVAYHLWFAFEKRREDEGGAWRVFSVKDFPEMREDAAYFLPRGFDGVRRVRPEAIEGERFWLAFRDESFDEGRKEPLRSLGRRGYRVVRVHEWAAAAKGRQRAFLVLVSRR